MILKSVVVGTIPYECIFTVSYHGTVLDLLDSPWFCSQEDNKVAMIVLHELFYILLLKNIVSNTEIHQLSVMRITHVFISLSFG